MIIKHRRGTTQEWLDLDIIPEAGELVIEECVDGIVKGKLGNGSLHFSELPYIADSRYLDACLTEISDLRETVYTDIDNIVIALDQHLNSNLHIHDPNAGSDGEGSGDKFDSITTLNPVLNQQYVELSEKISTNTNAIELLTNGASADEVDSVKDLIQYVKEHGDEVTSMQDSIEGNTAKLANLEAKLVAAESLINRLMGGAITSSVSDAGLVVSDEVNKIISYNDEITYSQIIPTDAKVADHQILKGVSAKYLSGPKKGTNDTLDRKSLGENGSGKFSLSGVTGNIALSGQWINREWSPVWLDGTNGKIDVNSAGYADQVEYGIGADISKMPAAMGNNKAEVLSGDVYTFDGWLVSGEKLTDSGIETYKDLKNSIPKTAISASATAQYKTIDYIRNKATKINTVQNVSVNANDAITYKISNIGSLAGIYGVDAYITSGKLTTNGKTGLGFAKDNTKNMSETFIWNAFQIPVAFDGEAKKLNDLGKKLKVTIYADTAVGIQRNNSKGARASIWVSGVPGIGNRGSYFTFTQSSATSGGTITTTYSPFSGHEVTNVGNSVGNITISTIAANDDTAKTDTAWKAANNQIVYSFDVDGYKEGFKIGVVAAFYNRQASGSKFYALVPKLSYKVEVIED